MKYQYIMMWDIAIPTSKKIKGQIRRQKLVFLLIYITGRSIAWARPRFSPVICRHGDKNCGLESVRIKAVYSIYTILFLV